MCSNNSLSSGGGGDCFYSKKPKRQRVPKRGPGVAELEKILREQEKITDFDKAKNDGFSLISSISSCYHHHQPQSPVISSSNSLPKTVSFAPNSNHFTPPITNFYNSPNNNNNSNNNNNPPLRSKNGGVQIAGSGIFLPEQALLPTMWNSCEASSVDVGGHVSAPGPQFSTNLSNGSNNQLFPSPRLMQRSQQSPPSMKNLFPYPVVSSSTTTSAGPCHGTEPPSNQTSYHHCTSIWPEEEKVVGIKRSRPFSMEIPPIPPLRYQIPTFSPQINRLDSSFSCGSHSTINLESSGRISREMKPVSSSLEVNIKNCNTEIGAAENGNFLLFGCPTTPPSTQEERPKFNPFPFQECNGDYNSQHSRSSSKGGSIHKKPFYSFILPREPIGMVEKNFISLNNDRVETRGDGIDLSLRL